MNTMMMTPAQNAQRVAAELEAVGVRFDPTQTYPGIWYAELERYTAQKLIKRYQHDTSKQPVVYNISGGIILLYAN